MTQRSNGRAVGRAGLLLASVGALPLAGCGGAGEQKAEATASPRVVVVTTEPAKFVPLERSVEAVGSLKGWEEVTAGSKQMGRVVEVLHDIGDRVAPGEPLVKLDTADAEISIRQAESKLLAELIRLGITREEAESYVQRYGYSEAILANADVEKRILALPAVEQARLSVEKADLDLNRQRQLAQRNAATIQALQDAENAQKVAKANYDNAVVTARTVIANALSTRVSLAQAQQTLEDMVIAVPKPSAAPEGFDSVKDVTYAVTKRDVSEGQMLQPGNAVMSLVLDDPLRLWAPVSERYSSQIKEGQEVEVTVSSYPGEVFRGKVARINPAVDPVSRTFQVETHLRNADRRLRPGGFAKCRIITAQDEHVTVVPLNSVVRTSGVVKLFVFQPNPTEGEGRGIAHEVRVQTGREDESWIEIEEGLPEGSLIVTSGQTQLADLWPVVLRAEQNEEPGTPQQVRPEQKESTGAPAADEKAEAKPAS